MYVNVFTFRMIRMLDIYFTFQPTMNMQRLKLVNKAFDNIDRTGSDIVSVIDLVKAYDCTRHSKYESGEWTKTKVSTRTCSEICH